ncbi:Uncharacterized protein dnm_065110 [Desulfonema magnum]|uniref:Uncharacterized protein n=1 Tax=Desulfonema magnum TaxID=45655 RepID=A0A975GR11_9BACT|nr:Uncharacterized protein dnm_065110 [Desulfonema magnum]
MFIQPGATVRVRMQKTSGPGGACQNATLRGCARLCSIFGPGLHLNTVDLNVSGFSGIFSGVRKMLFRKRKNIIFALRIRSELPKSTALGLHLGLQYMVALQR